VAPEEKRRIIGNCSLPLCEEEMGRLNLQNALLAQGTIYPDTIESGGTRARMSSRRITTVCRSWKK
jgi:GMP synthase (glutamine-hydrolysing)